MQKVIAEKRSRFNGQRLLKAAKTKRHGAVEKEPGIRYARV
jgi:hypothetical protein